MQITKGKKYWIGDPCYVYPDKEWTKFCDKLFSHAGNGDIYGFVDEYNDIPFFVISTAHGDGCYYLTKNGETLDGELGVDAGLLSVVPEELVNSWSDINKANRLGIWVTMDNNCNVETVDRGVFKFGPYKVDTLNDHDEDDHDEDDYDEDDYDEYR